MADTFATVARALAEHRDDVQAGLEKIGPSDCFTSAVRNDTIVERHERSTLNVAPVYFTRGGTHCWHPHDGGQTLYVTEGEGRSRSRREPVSVTPQGPLATSKPHTRRLLRSGVATSHYDDAALREAGADQSGRDAGGNRS